MVEVSSPFSGTSGKARKGNVKTGKEAVSRPRSAARARQPGSRDWRSCRCHPGRGAARLPGVGSGPPGLVL